QTVVKNILNKIQVDHVELFFYQNGAHAHFIFFLAKRKWPAFHDLDRDRRSNQFRTSRQFFHLSVKLSPSDTLSVMGSKTTVYFFFRVVCDIKKIKVHDANSRGLAYCITKPSLP